MASIQYVVNATDAASAVFEKIGLSADHLDQQLEDLSKRVATPEIDLQDAKATLGMIKAAERLDKLSAMVADPSVEVDTRKAQLEILRINAMLDRLDAKRVSVSVDVDRSFISRLRGVFGAGGGGLGGLFGGAGAAAGAGAQAGSAGFSSLGQYGQPAAIAAAVLGAAALAPALLPLGLGALVGGGGALGALSLGSKGGQLLLADRQALARARVAVAATPKTPATASQLLSLQQAQQKLARDQARYGEFQPLNRVFTGLQQTALGTFAGALEARGGPGGGPSFLTGLSAILKQIEGFIRSIGPQLGQMFRASLPFISQFVSFLEQAAKVLLPVFVQMLKQMQPFLPLIGQGLTALLQGFADMLKAMGPRGMQAAAMTFVGLMKAVGGILTVTGKAINFFAVAVQDVAHWLQQHWHVVEWLAAPVVTAVTLIIRHWSAFSHETGVIFDGIRHEIAHVWDQIYSDTIGNVIRIDRGIITWFDRIPGQILSALRGLGHSLYAFARSALTEFLNGAKSVAGSIFSWAKNFITSLPGQFMKWLHMSPPHPGSAFFDLGANMMHHMEAGMRSRAQNIGISAIAGGLTGGAGVQQWRGTVLRALAMEGLSPMLLGRVLYQMQTESGGRANAINLWDSNAAAGDPSRGLMQVIGSTFAAYHWPGTSWNIFDPLANIAAALNYARHRYGPTLMSGGMGIGSGRGYATGSWNVPYTGPAVVHQGEMIIPAGAAAAVRAGAGAGNVYQITVNVPPSANKADVGRQVVEVIREYERRSGPGWRK